MGEEGGARGSDEGSWGEGAKMQAGRELERESGREAAVTVGGGGWSGGV